MYTSILERPILLTINSPVNAPVKRNKNKELHPYEIQFSTLFLLPPMKKIVKIDFFES